MEQSELPNIYVGGLNFETNKETLENHFSQFGKVKSAVIIKDMGSGRSKGYGFVNYFTVQDRNNALAVPCHELDGRALTCSVAKESNKTRAAGFGGNFGGMGSGMGGMGGSMGGTMGGGGGMYGGGSSFNKGDDDRKVFVGGLHTDTEPEDIEATLGSFGKVINTNIKKDRDTGRSRGFAFVTFDSAVSAKKAMDAHFVEIRDKQVEVKSVNPNAGNQSQNFGSYNNGGMFGQGGFNSMQQYGYNQGYDSGSNWQNPGNVWQGSGDSSWNSSYNSAGYGSGGSGSYGSASGGGYGSAGSYGSQQQQMQGQGGGYGGQGGYGNYGGQSNMGQSDGASWY
ncbi:heterogeneous nuclear ribonucleoprotein A0-like isoform X2 [Acanthaster planci]|uniref:Heterogeneous nuclear ribonucleoprotein A0-like isoform X2 n=1 Tax=Acanthaster planci TaxID=133434 RepID=A0A8B7ZWQ8_ACAPL|nr:heterogeneous nuclear ribonucleoprotein A0-like isoform X2 [Acanthaster planci]